MDIYSFDLSLRSTGMAHLGSGLLTLRTSKTKTGETDLQDAVRVQSRQAMNFMTSQPDVVIIESGAMGAIRGKGYEELAALRWLVRDFVRHVLKFDVVEISPSHLKKQVTGNGRADKKEVQSAISDIAARKYWPEPANNDEADAAGLIVSYLKDTGQWRIDGKLQGSGQPGTDGAADGPLPF